MVVDLKGGLSSGLIRCLCDGLIRCLCGGGFKGWFER